MPQLDFDGANSKVSADKIQGQSGTTVTVPTGHKIAGTDANSITINGVNAVAVAPSTSGNVLTSTGSAWASTAAAGGGAWNFVSSASPTSGAYVDFTVSNTYGIYVVSFMDLVGSNTSENLYLRTSSDAGSSYDSGGTDYNWHYSHSGTGST